MSVILTITLPASEFDIGRVIEAVDGVHVELESIVPLGDQAMPILEVHDCDHESFARRLDDHNAVASVVAIDQSEDIATYAVEWSADLDSFYQALSDHHAAILKAIKDDDQWEFDLRFPSHESLSAFHDQIHENEIRLDVRRVSRSNQPEFDPQSRLSPAQREALELAISEGYYSIPRQTTTAELGTMLGISDQAVIERLRRAMAALGEEYLLTANAESQQV